MLQYRGTDVFTRESFSRVGRQWRDPAEAVVGQLLSGPLHEVRLSILDGPKWLPPEALVNPHGSFLDPHSTAPLQKGLNGTLIETRGLEVCFELVLSGVWGGGAALVGPSLQSSSNLHP